MSRLKAWVRPSAPVGLPGAPPPPRPDGTPPGGPNPIYGPQIIIATEPVGKSGTFAAGGYFFEDYLATLHGQAAMDQYDKMRRGDAVIAMCLASVKQPIIAANWHVEPVDDSDEERKIAKHVEFALMQDLDRPWKRHVEEALSFYEFGFSLFEITHKPVVNHPVWGTYTGFQAFGFRHQRTIQYWRMDGDSGRIDYVKQLAVGDLQSNAEMPGEFLLHMAIHQEGDNYEGISILRPLYGAWSRKQLYLKLMAIGMDKHAVPIPVGEIPQGVENTAQYTNFVQALQNYISHESQYIVHPTGFKVTLTPNAFDVAKCKEALDFEDLQIRSGFLANFLALGQTNVGSRSVSEDQSAFFYGAIQHSADTIADAHNLHTIPQFVKMNYGERDAYPKLKCSGISDKAGKELAEMLKDLATVQVIRPDDPLEDHLRKEMNLPKRSDIGVRIVQAPKAEQQGDNVQVENTKPAADPVTGERGVRHSEHGRRMTFATPKDRGRDAKRLIEAGSETLAALSRDRLSAIKAELVSSMLRDHRSTPKASRMDVARRVKAKGVDPYRRAVRDHLAGIATSALAAARKEVPAKKRVTLAGEKGFEFSEFDRLPKELQKRLQAQSDLLVDSQIADLEQALGFQYRHSVDSAGENEALLEKDLDEAGDRMIEGAGISTGSTTSVSSTVNDARQAFFFDDEVLEEVYAMQFVAQRGVCPLCDDLDGQVFDPNDPEALRYHPPLHPNCACILVPILKGGDEPKVTGLRPSSKTLEKFVRLAE